MHDLILVNEQDEPIGTMEKMEAHRQGLLHRAFSVFLFDDEGNMLLQQRADEKYHSPGLWTNACCSHPMPGEDTLKAAERRLFEELGITTSVQPAFQFTYRADFENGLIEHEYDHVFFGIYTGLIEPNPAEVKAISYESMNTLRTSLQNTPEQYTVWFKIAFPLLEAWMKNHPFSFQAATH